METSIVWIGISIAGIIAIIGWIITLRRNGRAQGRAFGRLEGNVEALYDISKECHEEVKALKGQFDEVKTKVDTLENKIHGYELNLNAFSQSLTTTNRLFENLREKMKS